MKKILLILTTVTLFTISCSEKPMYNSNMLGAEALIERVLPDYADNFIVESIPQENDKDVFEIETVNGKIVLRGSSVSSIGYALNWYLKYYCNCHISQAGQNLNLPEELPAVNPVFRKTSPHEYRYYLNYCTFNYTQSFWDWDEWEKELDWMALNGINLALSIKGAESLWQNVMKRLEYSDKEISNFICGPAYQAWWLMGNLEGEGGPVSQQWIDDQRDLQKKILARMKELEIEAVMQGFYGMVPFCSIEKFPKADIIDAGKWCGYQRPAFIVPDNPYFDTISTVYYEELEKLYGKHHFFSGDPFHEGGNVEDVNITECATRIQAAMTKAEPNSTWFLQGWLGNPDPKLLAGIDKERTLIIDLFCETNSAWNQTEAYGGYPFIWAIINNFGGRTGLYGKLDSTTMNLDEAIHGEYSNLVKGIGMIPEANRVNPFIFDWLFELAWYDKLPDPKDWTSNYTIYRYGEKNEYAQKAWNIYYESVYNINREYDDNQSYLCARPAKKIVNSAPWGFSAIRYEQQKAIDAANTLLECADEFKDVDAYQYDIVDFVRQVTIGEFETLHAEIIAAAENKQWDVYDEKVDRFLTIARKLDALVSSRKEFLLGAWIANARNIAPDGEKDLFERNARMLITTWGYGEQHDVLNDYAHREWGGLISDYYLPRWEMFFKELRKGTQDNINFKTWEEDWTKQTNPLPSEPSGDAIALSKDLLEYITK